MDGNTTFILMLGLMLGFTGLIQWLDRRPAAPTRPARPAPGTGVTTVPKLDELRDLVAELTALRDDLRGVTAELTELRAEAERARAPRP